MVTNANERSNDGADNNLYDGSSGSRKSKLHACAHHIAHVWGFKSCYEWIHDEGSFESGDDGVGSYVLEKDSSVDPISLAKCTGDLTS